MGYCVTTPEREKVRQKKLTCTQKTASREIFSYCVETSQENRSQAPELHQGNRLTTTKIASGIPYWPSRDPIEESGGLNLYGFVKNMPTVNIDYLGMATKYSMPFMEEGKSETYSGTLKDTGTSNAIPGLNLDPDVLEYTFNFWATCEEKSQISESGSDQNSYNNLNEPDEMTISLIISTGFADRVKFTNSSAGSLCSKDGKSGTKTTLKVKVVWKKVMPVGIGIGVGDFSFNFGSTDIMPTSAGRAEFEFESPCCVCEDE